MIELILNLVHIRQTNNEMPYQFQIIHVQNTIDLHAVNDLKIYKSFFRKTSTQIISSGIRKALRYNHSCNEATNLPQAIHFTSEKNYNKYYQTVNNKIYRMSPQF